MPQVMVGFRKNIIIQEGNERYLHLWRSGAKTNFKQVLYLLIALSSEEQDTGIWKRIKMDLELDALRTFFLACICMHGMSACVYNFLPACGVMYVGSYKNHRLALGIFFCFSLPYIVKQAVFLKPETFPFVCSS